MAVRSKAWPGAIRRRFARLGSDRRGAIVVLAALCMTTLLVAVGVALELGALYVSKSTAQRIADQALIAAGFAYTQSYSAYAGDGNGAAELLALAQAQATSIALANGAPAGAVTIAYGTSPRNDGNTTLVASVQMPVTLNTFFQLELPLVTTVNASASSWIEVLSQPTNCVTALGPNGILIDTGSTLTATGCAISSDGAITAGSATQGAGGGTINAPALYAVGNISKVGSATITGTEYTDQAAPKDPYNPLQYSVSPVFNRLPTVANLSNNAPIFPSIGTAPTGGTAKACSGTLTLKAATYGAVSTTYSPSCTTINFTGSTTTTTSITGGLILNGYAVTVNFCPGTYKIVGSTTQPSIYVGGSGAVTINLTTSAAICGSNTSGSFIFDLWYGIDVTNGSLTVNGSGTFNVMGGILNGASEAMTFNNTAGSTSTFNVKGGISIANGSAVFPNGTYNIDSASASTGACGYSVGICSPSYAVTFGNGSFEIVGGIYLGPGAHMTFGSAAGANPVFQIVSAAGNGNAITVGGGSALTIGSFTNVDINGPVSLSGSVTLGAGIYTINANISSTTGAATADTGLNACPASGGGTITGSGVSIITNGAFCFGAGFNSIDLTSPAGVTTPTLGNIDSLVLASDTTAATTVTSGATHTVVTGTIYVPHSALDLNGGGTLGEAATCLIIIASSITANSANGITSTCNGLGAYNYAGSFNMAQ